MTDSGRSPRFWVGQRVRILDERAKVHHRVPAYAKGHVGVVERVCDKFGRPETFIRGNGDPETHLYRVRICQVDLWPDYGGPPGDKLEIEIFEHWLEEAP